MRLHLETHAHQFARQSQRLLKTFDATNHTDTGSCCSQSHGPTRVACVINLNDYWSQFCKNVMVSSAVGGWTSRSGVMLSRVTGLGSNNDVMGLLRSTYRSRPPFWEPNWTVASDFIDACRRVGISNLADVSAAIGATGSPAEELRLTRNYLAHRNADTAARAISVLAFYGATAPLDVDAVITRPAHAGAHLFETWVNGLTAVAFTAC